jgi:transcriptional regulator with XRE-family HTH domain
VAVVDEWIPCLFLFASELLADEADGLPDFLLGAESRYAVLLDGVPAQEILRIPSMLNLHRPDQRAHLTEDEMIVRRAAMSLLRRDPTQAILDAWMFGDELTLLLADLGKRTVDSASVPSLRGMKPRERRDFEIDKDGSYLHWPGRDVHLGVSQILQAVDPEYLAQVEIERNALDYMRWALESWRRDLGLRQVDIEGISERHVRRIEQGVSRLTVQAADRFARAFGLSSRVFLDELAARTRETREKVAQAEEPAPAPVPEVVVLDLAA